MNRRQWLLIVSVWLGLAAMGGAALVCEDPAFDFGEALDTDRVSHVYTLRNAGRQTVRILKVTSSCGCTTTTAEPESLAPGERSALTVQVDLRGRAGPQVFALDVITDQAGAAGLPLVIRGTVLREITLAPQSVLLHAREGGPRLVETVTLTATQGPAFRITGFGVSDPVLGIEAQRDSTAAEHAVTVTVDAAGLALPFQGTVTLQTDHPRRTVIQIPVSVVPARTDNALPVLLFYRPDGPSAQCAQTELLRIAEAFPGRVSVEHLDLGQPGPQGRLAIWQEVFNHRQESPVTVVVPGQAFLAGIEQIRSGLQPAVESALGAAAPAAPDAPRP